MTKPGTQWVIRKDIYTRVNTAIDEALIQFSRRELRVQIPGLDDTKYITEDQAKEIGAVSSGIVPEPKPV